MTSPPFRVETVPVRRTGRGPVVIAAIAAALVAVSIVKPWSGADPGTADQSSDLASPAAVAIRAAVGSPAETARAAAPPAAGSPAPGQVETSPGIVAAQPAPLAPGQVACGSSGWELATLGTFLRWTVRTLTAITPVAAEGPGDASIPVLSLGDSDVAGVSACAPSISPTAPGRASRVVGAWRRGPSGATTIPAAVSPPAAVPAAATTSPEATDPAAATASRDGTASAGAAVSGAAGAAAQATDGSAGTAVTWEPLTLALLDPPPSGGSAATPPAPASAAELCRPVPATQNGRWPAGRYLLRLASPDGGGDRWIAIDISAGR